MSNKENPSYYGQLREFSAQNSDWVIYKRRLDNYFSVNNITEDERRKALLLNALDEESYKLIFNLSLPRSPEDKTYKELTTLFDTHFKVTDSVFVARSKFFAAFKDAYESASDWAARVRSLAVNCKFDEAVFDMMLRDRFILGFEKGSTQSKLYKSDITSKFANVIEVAVREMAAEADSSSSMQISVKKEPAVHVIQSRRDFNSASTSGSKNSEKCACCGRKNHSTQKCRYSSYACNL